MPMPSNGQNFVRPQSSGVGGWMGKLFGGIADDRRARQMAQIQFDLHQAKSQTETENINSRVSHRVAAESAGKVYVHNNQAKTALKTFKAFTEPKVETTDKNGRKRTKGGLGLSIENLKGFDRNMLPEFQAQGLNNRNKNVGKAPVDTNSNGNGDGGNPPPPPGGGGSTGNKKSKKPNTAAAGAGAKKSSKKAEVTEAIGTTADLGPAPVASPTVAGPKKPGIKTKKISNGTGDNN